MEKFGKTNTIMKPVIVLTACINPAGMSKTVLQDVNIRKNHYYKALNWYLDNTNLPILFVENTGYDISKDFSKAIYQGRLEAISFDGNNYPRNLGKGYGEALILKKAFSSSLMLKNAEYVIKITGRHIFPEIMKMIRYSSKTKFASVVAMRFNFNKDRKLDSRYIHVHKSFFLDYFLPNSNLLNDSLGFTFERLLYESLFNWHKDGYCVHMLYKPLYIIGVTGSSGLIIPKPSLYVYIRNVITSFLFNVGLMRF